MEANPQIASRSGSVAVNGQRTTIAQTGRPCTFDVVADNAQFAASAGQGRITVNTLAGCSWRATTAASWIQIASTAVSGPGGITFAVAANSGSARDATIAVADKQIVVSQAAAQQPGPAPDPSPDCTPIIAPLTIDTSSEASTQTIQIALGATCSWSAASGAAWLTITSAAAGTGSAVLAVAVAANTGPARTGALTVAGQTVTIRQTAVACAFSLNPVSQSFPAGGGSGGRFTVTAPAGCSWTASKSVPWIDLGQGSGAGTGEVTFSVQANTATSPRSGTITVAGQIFAVSQAAAACTYALAPQTLAVAVDGGRNRVTVTTASNCSWTAVSGASWVEVSNQSGSGTGEINFNVQANPTTSPRTTTITVNGQTTTINQAAMPCTYVLNPASANIAAAGGPSQFTVTTQGGCAWTAVSGADWVTVNSPANGNGSGTGDVLYTVQANPDQTQRSTTVTVGGQAHTVTQAAAAAPPPPPPCTYTLNPPSGSSTAAGGNGTFTVTTQAGCAWTATTGDAWITVNTASGTATGDVSYTVQANGTGASRTGTITAGGQMYSLTQAP